ncbi:MAG: MoaD/ThiS family protein [Candidatus Hodarchaeales archaeon]
MITVTIELVATVKNPFPSKKRKEKVTLDKPITIVELLSHIGFSHNDIEHLVQIVNGVRVRNDYLIADGDHIFVTMPIGGG